ncbi:LapA family protein [Deinococcus arenicola]|uniref:LapA family protein n=1 Tax=Deinococcus arenicola TaxID=2994950 RepID=A0ABU4DTW9_9DEIO|nr:LapA family protein [Deinococcus sp. ZS9-10]MDV6375865.1 LapA family protein [Deinococcus sp. ZS9-10]
MRTIVLIAGLVFLLIFAALNFSALMAPQPMNLGFIQYITAPIGLIMLLVAVFAALLFYFWAGISNLKAQADTAKLLRDMESLRVSLDSQEGSRFAELRSHLDTRMNALGTGDSSSELRAVNARIDGMQRDVNLQLAQLDDYLKAKLGDAPATRDRLGEVKLDKRF